MKTIRHIVAFWKRLNGAEPSEIELYFLEKNIADGVAELAEMDREWEESESICCPACRFSPRYSLLCDRQDRRRARREVLLRRLGRSATTADEGT